MSTIGANTGALKSFKRHQIALVCGLCIAVAGVVAGGYGVSERDGSVPAPSPSANIQLESSRSDWKHVYYLVTTQEQADQILAVEAEAQNEIAAAGLELPHRSVHTFVVDSPDQEYLLGTMLAEVDTEAVQFVDLRAAPLTAIESQTPSEFDLPSITPAPESITTLPLFQPYPCSEANLDEATAAWVAPYGNCQ